MPLEPQGGCKTHGQFEVCGHTTNTCPDTLKELRASGELDKMQQRTKILKELKFREGIHFAGGLSGMHEYTDEDFRAAQKNMQRIEELKSTLSMINLELGLRENSREQVGEDVQT